MITGIEFYTEDGYKCTKAGVIIKINCALASFLKVGKEEELVWVETLPKEDQIKVENRIREIYNKIVKFTEDI